MQFFKKIKMGLKLPLLFLFGIFMTNASAQYYNQEISAEIKINTRDQFLDITGTATNKTEINKSLRYELSVIKDNNGNHSKNQQAGRFTLDPDEFKELSKTSINIDAKSKIIVLLLVYDLDDNLLGKDRYVINEDDKDKKNEEPEQDVKDYSNKGSKQNVSEDGVVLRGIVTQNTKTKAGSDFYNYFSSDYRLSNLDSEKIIAVNEIFNLGRSTRIEVKIDQNLVYRFFVQPKDSFLKSMSKSALQRVRRYLQQQERNAEQIKRY